MSNDNGGGGHILTETAEGICRIRINRPEKKNALTIAMYEAIVAAMKDAEANPAVRVILFQGNGSCFTAGNDVMDFINAPPADESSPVFQFLQALVAAEKVLVAGVHGAAVGIGTTMLLHCDYVVAATSSKLHLPFVNLGLCPEAGASFLLPLLVGYQRASELLLLGEPFDADRAHALGLVNQVCEEADLTETAMKYAKAFAAKPPAALRASKSLLKHGYQQAVMRAISKEGKEFLQRLSSPEAAEAFQAFAERRKPDFSQFT